MTAAPAWSEDVIVLSGHARTGTTLMQGLLCASPDVMPVSAEAVILRDIVLGHARSQSLWLDYSRHYFASRAALTAYYRESAANWLSHVRRRFATDRRLLQKVPQSVVSHLPALAELLPKARFVVMLRDLRDVVVSQTERHQIAKLDFDPTREIEAFVQTYAGLVPAKSLTGRLAFVPYERLVGEPEGTIRIVSRFLGIAPPANVGSLEWVHLRDPGVSTSSPLDGRPVTAERVARYKSAAASPALARIERQRLEIEQKIGLRVFGDDAGAPAQVMLL